MRHRRGFTAVELLIVVAILAILLSLLIPSLSAARRSARSAKCMSQLHAISTGLIAYSSSNAQRQPPFAFTFSDLAGGNIPLSGHWGGAQLADDPDAFCRDGVNYLNLYALTFGDYLTQASLACPDADLAAGSFFPRTTRFSTYCLRFPLSRDLFADSPNLAGPATNLLRAYLGQAGGQPYRVYNNFQTVPLVRNDRTYRLELDGQPTYDPGSGAIVSDAFLWQDYTQSPAGGSNLVRRKWCHGNQFNVLYGTGAVKTITDDGTVAANSISNSTSLPDDHKYQDTYAERIWQFFEIARKK